jgi:D-glycerate 3-kinase
MLNAEGCRTAHLSLDDFYLGRAERRRLASRVHPLFVTRGPPGTHDIDGALAFLASVKKGGEAKAPSFDKIRDEPSPQGQIAPAELQVLVFEGWCLGARPQDEQALSAPVNMLERVFDRDAIWRRAANDALSGVYQMLFTEFDELVFLRAPDFDVVHRWRTEQEATLAADLPPETRVGVMAPDEISFFIQHFERITRFMMDDLPARADLTLHLDERRRVIGAVSR